MRPLVILGAGGHAKMVIEAARSGGQYQPTVCLSASANSPASILGVPIVEETDSQLRLLAKRQLWAVVAIGENRLRQRLQHKLSEFRFAIATIVASTAWLSPSARIGAGSVLMPNSSVGAEVELGLGVIVNTNASVDHDGRVEEFAHLAPGAHLAGNVHIGARAFVGLGTSIIPTRRIGADAVIGAGATIIRDVPPNETWVGCPARPVARRDQRHVA
ncbi:MAG: acetyltransferase [Pirellulaceae bacterium]